jgi:cytochrome c2
MLKLLCTSVVALTALTDMATAQGADDMAKKGTATYRLCAACHSLQPGMHLSGPSLANLWGKRAATTPDFGRYTDALKKTGIVWDENTLYAWVADPQAMVPGTTMTFRGIENDESRAQISSLFCVWHSRRMAGPGEAMLRKPMTGNVDCCACAASGHAAAALPNRLMKVRRAKCLRPTYGRRRRCRHWCRRSGISGATD